MNSYPPLPNPRHGQYADYDEEQQAWKRGLHPHVETRAVPTVDEDDTVPITQVALRDVEDSSREALAPPVTFDFGVVSLSLAWGETESRGFNDGENGRRPSGSDEFCFLPGVDDQNEDLTIRFELYRQAAITGVKLEVFPASAENSADDSNPIWIYKWGAPLWGIADATMETFRESVQEDESDMSTGELVWSALFALSGDERVPAEAEAAAFPDSVLTIAHSPYQVRMTVSRRASAEDTDEPDQFGYPLRAWSYAHIRIHSLILSYGSSDLLPEGQRANQITVDDWDFTNDSEEDQGTIVAALNDRVATAEQELIQSLTDRYGEHNDARARPTAEFDAELVLPSTVFRGAADKADTFYNAYRAMWGDGPRIPLVATVRLCKADGEAASNQRAAAVQQALRGLQLLWDWEDPRCDPEVEDPLETWFDDDSLPDSAVEKRKQKKYLRDLFADNKARFDAPAAYNCPEEYGGKHGPNSPRILLEKAEEGSNLPNEVAACPTRAWAVKSTVEGEDEENTCSSAILFQPSRFAGDTYRIAVYALPNVQLSAEEWGLQGTPLRELLVERAVPSARTGRLEVVRKITATCHYVAAAANAFDVTVPQRMYRLQAGIRLDVQAEQLDPQRYLEQEDERLYETLRGFTFGTPYAALVTHFALRQDGVVTSQLDTRSPHEVLTAIEDAFLQNDGRKRNVFVYREDPVFANGTLLQIEGDPSWLGVVLRSRTKTKGIRRRRVVKTEVMLLKGGVPTSGVTLVAPHDGNKQMTIAGSPELLSNSNRRALLPKVRRLDFWGFYVNLRGLYMEFYSATTHKLTAHGQQRMERYAAEYLPADCGAAVLYFQLVRSTDYFSGGSYVQPRSSRRRALATAANAPAELLAQKTETYNAVVNELNEQPNATPIPVVEADEASMSADAVVAHELGHALFIDHALNLVKPGPNPPNADEAQHVERAPCLMNYDAEAAHFCGICSIRLRGWEFANVNRTQEVVPELSISPNPLILRVGATVPPTLVRVSLNHGFEGNVTLRWTGDEIEAYEDAGGTTQIDGGEVTCSGHEAAIHGLGLFLKAIEVGEANNVSITATFEGDEDTVFRPEEHTAILTTVAAETLGLDAYPLGSSPSEEELDDLEEVEAPATDPLSDDAKLTEGVALPVQDSSKERLRACVVVRKASFPGELVVQCADDRLRLFESADPQAEGEGVASITKSPDDIPDDGLQLWVEGHQPSEALRDTGVLLKVAGETLDEVKFTVVQVSLVATVPVTPVREDRSGYGHPPDRSPYVFRPPILSTADFSVAEENLVLVAGSIPTASPGQGPLELALEVKPNEIAPDLTLAAWSADSVARADDDAAGIAGLIPGARPTLTPSQDAKKATLQLDAAGSFHITSSWAFTANQDATVPIRMNLISVGAQREALACRTGNDCFTNTLLEANCAVQLHAGFFADDVEMGGIILDGTILLVGGGPDGRRGTDEVACGWVQNAVAPRHNVNRRGVRVATYRLPDSVDDVNVYSVWLQQGGGGAQSDILPGQDEKAHFVNYPIMDKSFPATKANEDIGCLDLPLGGNRAGLTEADLGLRVQQTAYDSPKVPTTFRHPDADRPTLLLHSLDWELCFDSFLCVYSRRWHKVIGVAAVVSWDVLQTATLDWTDQELPLEGPNGMVASLPGVDVVIQPIAPAVDAQVVDLTPAVETNLEIGQPGLHTTQGDDARE